MNDTPSRMAREIAEIPEVIDRLLRRSVPAWQQAARAVHAADPCMVATVARGSSDHVCTFLKYAIELSQGVPVASLGPSVASIYRAHLRLERCLCISVSQSGQSPDIVAMTRAAVRDGALALALTNDPASPLAHEAEIALDIQAGPELSVAATKTFVASAVVGLGLLAQWRGDAALDVALARLPEALERAVRIDWPELRAVLEQGESLYTIGRGPTWAIAGEAALKFKETCQMHAESYSSAEVLHGPVAIVGPGFPVLALAAADAAEAGLVEVAGRMAGMGARVFVTSDKAPAGQRLEHVRTGHPLTDPLALIVSFYAMAERLARARGGNPDAPRHLRKVTETR